MPLKRPKTHQIDLALAVKATDITDGNTYRLGPHADTTNPDLFSGGTVADGNLGIYFVEGVSAADQVKIDADTAPLVLSLTVNYLNPAGDTVASFGVVSPPTAADGDTPGLVGLLPIPKDLEIGNVEITVADGGNDFDSLYICWVK